jgi:chromosome segregation and condensation protein ScpB
MGEMNMMQVISDSQLELDEEWVELMLCARAKGLTVEEVSKVLRILKEEGQAVIEENAV